MDEIDQRPASQKLADRILGGKGKLEEFVRTRRAAGSSWRQIEQALFLATKGEVNVTGQTIKIWYGGDERPADEPDGQVAV